MELFLFAEHLIPCALASIASMHARSEAMVPAVSRTIYQKTESKNQVHNTKAVFNNYAWAFVAGEPTDKCQYCIAARKGGALGGCGLIEVEKPEIRDAWHGFVAARSAVRVARNDDDAYKKWLDAGGTNPWRIRVEFAADCNSDHRNAVGEVKRQFPDYKGKKYVKKYWSFNLRIKSILRGRNSHLFPDESPQSPEGDLEFAPDDREEHWHTAWQTEVLPVLRLLSTRGPEDNPGSKGIPLIQMAPEFRLQLQQGYREDPRWKTVLKVAYCLESSLSPKHVFLSEGKSNTADHRQKVPQAPTVYPGRYGAYSTSLKMDYEDSQKRHM
ncbi:hypothetical protein F4777DRAFT_578741 [Nemania sp. FL0916]|nr:hypothetical protein F4777DRAFT_578741 [Nemania sp. FL0916]